MLNRRKLIQLILSELATERPYFDFKQSIDLTGEANRGRLLQDIAALANTNRQNLSFVIVGIDDTSKIVVGATAIDDVRLQQLVREYLSPRLHVLYEPVHFPHSGSKRSLGLLTIHPSREPVSIMRRIWKLEVGARYIRDGSENRRVTDREDDKPGPHTSECNELIARASVRLEDTLTDLLSFYGSTSPGYHPTHLVYHDQHVVCYSGWRDDHFGIQSLTEVNVELLSEGVSLFWSAVKNVTVKASPDQFTVCEHALLFWNDEGRLHPFQETSLVFFGDGTFRVDTALVFDVPSVTQDAISALIKDYEYCLSGEDPKALKVRAERGCWEMFPSQLLLATLNGSTKARAYLTNYMNGRADGAYGEARTDALSILRRLERSSSNDGTVDTDQSS